MSFENVKISELREILKNEHGVTDEKTLKGNKQSLINLIVELKEMEDDLGGMLEETEEEADNVMRPYNEKDAKKNQPTYGSELWHEYVMTQFRDDELMEGAPTCDGCRRVIENVLGLILSSQITHVTPPSTQNNGTATVGVKIQVHVTNESHPLCGTQIVCEDIADVNRDNCDAPYHKYATATASSRAEGRALRKLLRLRNITTAEEVSEKAEISDGECEWSIDEPISDSQINVIDMICKRVDMNVMDFVNSGKKTYENIEMVTKSVAQRMIQELNKIQRKAKPKPDSVGKYVINWRNQ